MRQLQNDLEKIGSFYQNHRSNIPPDSAFTYGLINSVDKAARSLSWTIAESKHLPATVATPDACRV